MKKELKLYKKIDFPPLTDEQKLELENLRNMKDEEIDFSDIPRKTNEDFEKMQFYYKHQEIVSEENATWLLSSGSDLKTMLNAVLKWARLQGCPIKALN